MIDDVMMVMMSAASGCRLHLSGPKCNTITIHNHHLAHFHWTDLGSPWTKVFLIWTLNLEGHSDAVLMALSTTGLEREGEREERQIWHTWASRSKSREPTSTGCPVYKDNPDYTMQTSICARHANCTGTKKPTRACKECIAIQAQPPCCCRVEMSLRPQQRFEAGRV